jgi:hypothetical protein
MAKKAKTAKGAKHRKAKKAAPKKAVVRKAAGAKKKAAKKAAKKKVRALRPAHAGALMAGMAATPYRCVYTAQDDVCLRFEYNPATGRYDLPPGGVRVPCAQCEYF